MSNPRSALNGRSFEGFARIREIGPLGMITLRAKDNTEGLGQAIKVATGCALPSMRLYTKSGDNLAAWMSPDEYLLILPYQEVQQALAAMKTALGDVHHLAVDVSDARAVFRIEGEKAEQVLRKLAPVDFANLGTDEIRRTRLAQIPAAFWKDAGGYSLVCFRSVAEYAMEVLQNAAHKDSALA